MRICLAAQDCLNGLGHHTPAIIQIAHDCSVLVIQMADGFVQEDEVERLAEAADKGDSLLLAKR